MSQNIFFYNSYSREKENFNKKMNNHKINYWKEFNLPYKIFTSFNCFFGYKILFFLHFITKYFGVLFFLFNYKILWQI